MLEHATHTAGAESTSEVLCSIVIPAYNEEHRITPTLERIAAHLSTFAGQTEIIVVDDGSRDGTTTAVHHAAQSLPANVELRLLSYEPNRGKGAAVRTGCLAAVGRYVLFTDADLATPIEEASKLYAALDAGNDVAIGSRIQPDGQDHRSTQPAYRRALGKVYHGLVSLLTVPGIDDTQCGFKAFTHQAAQALFSRQTLNSIVFDTELLFLAQQSGMRVAQVPVSWSNIAGSRMNVTIGHAVRVMLDLCSIRLRRYADAPAEAIPASKAKTERPPTPM